MLKSRKLACHQTLQGKIEDSDGEPNPDGHQEFRIVDDHHQTVQHGIEEAGIANGIDGIHFLRIEISVVTMETGGLLLLITLKVRR